MNSPLLRVQTSILTFLAAAFIGGCATLPERPQTPVSFPGSEVKSEARAPLLALAESWRHKAREFEKTGDLPKALKALEIVKTLSPEDLESGTRIADLKNQLPAAADRHFQKGLALFRNHSLTLARKEFLAAIYLKPDHAEALHFLKEKLPGEDSLSYEMKRGETPREVSQKIYGDPQKDFIIAYFNELKGDGPVDFPRSLKIPLLSPVPQKGSPAPAKGVVSSEDDKPPETRAGLEKARGAYREHLYEESAALTERILNADPTNREARELMNAAYYQWGKQLGQEKRYREALEAFQRVDSGYKDTPVQIAQSRKEMADAHYINGVKLFTQEEVEEAIQEWEAALALEPKHPKAKKDIESARNLLQKLEKIK